MLAIHHRPGSFSDEWLKYCEEHKVPCKIVDCLDQTLLSRYEIAEDLCNIGPIMIIKHLDHLKFIK